MSGITQNEMHSYRFVLKNDKRRFYKSFSLFLLILNAVAICLFLYYQPQTAVQRASGLICIILAASIIVLREKMPAHRLTGPGVLIVMLAIAAYWLALGYWGAAIVVAILAILYNGVNKVPEVIVTKEQILYPSFPVRTIEWATVSNLVLKDGLLTIDLRNNHIIQQPVQVSANTATEREINEFCREQIARNPKAGLQEN